MGECNKCGTEREMTNSCNYCGRNHCSKHRLPENHNCIGLAGANTLGPEFRQIRDKPSFLGKIKNTLTPSFDRGFYSETSAESEAESSADVNPDGSIGSSNDLNSNSKSQHWPETFSRWLSGVRADRHHRGRCPNCGRYIRRLRGQRITHCRRCEWKPGLPFLRLLTHYPNWAYCRAQVVSTTITLFQVTVGILALIGVVWLATGPGQPLLGQLLNQAGQEDVPVVGGYLNDSSILPVFPTSDGSSTEIIDSDNDRLSDSEERRLYGTEPTTADTDGDGLLDGWEVNGQTPDGVALKDSSPLRKDLYLTVTVTEGIQPLSSEERRDLRRIWREMPVQNPGNTTGIDLHLQSTIIAEKVTVRNRDEQIDTLQSQYYTTDYLHGRPCVTYQVLLVHVENETFAGYGASPGFQSIADGTLTRDYGERNTIRTTVVTHEVLHNVVGELSNGTGRGHTSEGWLSHSSTYGDDFFMAETTASHLSEYGFDGSEYYQQVVC